ncbi:MAG: hypothetical protein QXO75_08130 [Nitrososphaerota archaeon]
MEAGSGSRERVGVITRALRPSKKSDVQYIIASELAAGMLSRDPLLKIRHILEAFITLSEDEKRQIASREDLETYNKLYQVTISLLGIKAVKEFDDECPTLIIPWVAKSPELYAIARGESKPDNYSEEEWREVLKRRFHETLYPLSHPSDILQIKTTFIIKTMPIAVRLASMMLENFISQEVWEKTIEGLGGKRHIVKTETGPIQD